MPLNRPFARPCLSKISQRCIVRHPYRLRAFATAPSPSNSSRTRRIPWRYVFPALFLAIGGAVGLSTRFWWTSRALAPVPFTEEDDAALDALADQIEELDIVKKMRAEGKQLHSDASLGDANPGKGPWIELDIKENMTETSTDREKTTRPFTRSVMGGIQGLGVQRAFWNTDTRELVAVVWIGPRLSGWPTVAHGGAIVAMFQDAMSRMIAGPHMTIGVYTPVLSDVDFADALTRFNTNAGDYRRHIRETDLQLRHVCASHLLRESGLYSTRRAALCTFACEIMVAVTEGSYKESSTCRTANNGSPWHTRKS